MAGVDMSMVPYDFSFYDILLKLVKENKVPVSRIDEAVSRILRVKFQLGLFENPYPNNDLRNQFATAEATQTNLKAARESITLLKNSKHVLPLPKSSRVLVTGPTANSLSALNGGWTVTWQGDDETLYPKDKKTLLQAIQEKLGAQNVTYLPGASFQKPIDTEAVVAAARNSDVAIVCLGEKPYTETLGNIEDLTLEHAQLELAERLIQTGKPVILVLIEGRPRVIQRIADGAAGIIMGYLPGMEGGPALADVLFGDFNPSGKLPFSYPRFPNSIIPYDHKHMEIVEGNFYNPQFPFGFGLSYTSFQYTDLKVTPEAVSDDQNITVSVTVTNTGKRPGQETVQLYLNQAYASVSKPVRQIKGFQKIDLQAGESRQVSFTLTPYDLSFIGRDNKRIIEKGAFKVMVDKLEKSFILR
jgi:beta-glucosidase